MSLKLNANEGVKPSKASCSCSLCKNSSNVMWMYSNFNLFHYSFRPFYKWDDYVVTIYLSSENVARVTVVDVAANVAVGIWAIYSYL